MRRLFSIRNAVSCASFAVVIAATLLPTPQALAAAYPQPQGAYVLTSSYNSAVGDTRGWKVEWKTPALSNLSTAWGAVGQWYYNLETGIYRSPDGWFVYYFNDDNGTLGNNPNCNGQWTNSSGQPIGGTCGGTLGGFGAGKKIYFKYEWCDTLHNASLTGSRICAYVDMEDGLGWQFLAEDARGTVEMYAHDMETFDPASFPRPRISCTNIPTKMVQQQRRRTDGTWSNLGGNWWNFSDSSSFYKFQNKNLAVTPSNWESCDE